MSVQEDKTCYNCKNFRLCFMKHLMWNALLACGSSLSEKTCNSLFRVIGDNCSLFDFKKEE